ncbi:TetR/AcrR family transcriptional regulator, partial [Shewanella sp. 0m-11]
YQFSYALAQLMGHSDKRIPKQADYASWLTRLEPAANAA